MTKQKFAGKALLLLVVLMVAAAGTIKADDGQRSDLESMRRQVDLLQRLCPQDTAGSGGEVGCGGQSPQWSGSIRGAVAKAAAESPK